MGTKRNLRKEIDAALFDLEQLADEIRVKLHLANMDMRDAWSKLEPKLQEAKAHGRAATEESKAAVTNALQALREFAEKF